jgi:surfeit locus 1 family protein
VKRSTLVFLIISLAFAAGCARLGFWQLARRKQRLAMNARIESRILAAPIPVATIDGDTTKSRFSRAVVSGTPDYGHEILLTYKGHDGSPGVDVFTPVRVPTLDSAVLVNRGWVYSPDGSSIELSRWRDTTNTFSGYVDSFESAPGDSVRGQRIRRVSYQAIARAIPYPIKRFYVVALDDSASTEAPPATPRIIRLGAPKLDEGPHLSYAFQWFGFATIALVGGATVAARSMQKVSS